MTYDAFISYSHVDARLAAGLQSEVQRFAKPWYRRRAVHLFRDETTLVTAPELWPPIEAALADSEWFVLLASPNAAESRWVEREIAWWLEHRDAARILPVVTAGTWVWDDAINALTPDATSVPPSLRQAFSTEPRHLDLSWIDDDTVLSARNPQFAAAVADLAAPIRGVPKDDLVGEDVRQHRRARRLATTALTSMAVLLVLALIATTLAVQSRTRAQDATAKARRATFAAERAATQADAARVAATSQVEGPKLFDVGFLLAAEANRLDDTIDTRGAMLRSLNLNPAVTRIDQRFGDHIFDVRVRPDRKAIAVSHENGEVDIWPTKGDEPLGQIKPWNSPTHESYSAPGLAYSSDGALLATAGSVDATVEIRDAEGRVVATATDARGVSNVMFAQDDTMLIGSGNDGLVYRWHVADGTPYGPPTSLDAPHGALGIDVDPSTGIGYFGTTVGAVAAVSLDSGQVLWTHTAGEDGDYVYNVDLSPQGGLLAFTGTNGKIGFLDPSTGTKLGDDVGVGTSQPNWVAFNPSGTKVITSTDDAALHLIDPVDRYEVATYRGVSAFYETWLNDDRLMSAGTVVAQWDTTSSGATVHQQSLDQAVRLPRAAATTTVACAADSGDIVGLPRSGHATTVLYRNSAPEECLDLAVDHQTSRAAVLLYDKATTGRHLVVIDTVARRVLVDRRGAVGISVDIAPGGGSVVVGDGYYLDDETGTEAPNGGGYDLYALPSGKRTGHVRTDDLGPFGVAFIDARTLAVALTAPTHLDVYDVATGKRVHRLASGLTTSNLLARYSIDRTPDGKSVLAAGEDGSVVEIETAATGRARTFHLSDGRMAAATRVDRNMVSMGADLQLQLTDQPSGRLVGPLTTIHRELGNGRLVRPFSLTDFDPGWGAVVPLPSGRVLVSDGTKDVYEVSITPDEWLQEGCAVVGRNLTKAEWKKYMGTRPYHRTCGAT